MKSKATLLALTTALMTQLLSPVAALEADQVSVSGTYLGVYNYLKQGDSIRAQFDYAANIDFEFQLSPNLSGIIQLQGGAGGGTLGFVGPGVEVTDINLSYDSEKCNSIFTFGSFDTPFGRQVANLTNNADSFNSNFLSNDLLYSALAGPVGTLNTLGVMQERDFSWGATTLALTNGTGENAANNNNTFEVVAGVESDKILKDSVFGVSYIHSKDLDDASDNNSNSFKADIDGWIVDFSSDLIPGISLDAYAGQLSYGDDNDATEDQVNVWMLEASHDLKNETCFVAARVSSWQPEDKDGNGTGISTALATPGFQTGAVADTEITRIQIGGGHYINDDLVLKAEIFRDDYKTGSDVTGVVAYVNGRF